MKHQKKNDVAALIQYGYVLTTVLNNQIKRKEMENGNDN